MISAQGPEFAATVYNLGVINAPLGVSLTLLHGYNLGVINAPLELMGDWLNTTNYNRTKEYLSQSSKTRIISWIVSIYYIGDKIGGAFAGFFSERFGHKAVLLINNVFAFLAAILFGFCKMAGSWEMIVAGRLFIGINNGLNARLVPKYLSTIAPPNLRGAIGYVYQPAVAISILFLQIMGSESLYAWHVMLALTTVPAVFQLCVLLICPEQNPENLLLPISEPSHQQGQAGLLPESCAVAVQLNERARRDERDAEGG
ncbi:solute carrier family 2, facilitated glucose transporter member 5 [Hyalella azteca]|uniref:Solute carrier family 2, facilitated glucose transporter member 5 n=1 Tax=Hyalella azteca TaxID=294128 RepID=A0A8B7P146_HYAAZ|nr:solute carrier family 2, facilitated glucose transporter member 5 [Hyalella azteca]